MNADIPIHSTGPIRFGLRRLVSKHPLYAVLIDKWKLTANKKISTIGIFLDTELRINLNYNQNFITSITPEELVNVLIHEVHHVIFQHLQMQPEKYPNKKALIIAQEVTANEYITGKLPGDPILLKMYPNLPPNESTIRRYQRLNSDTTNNHQTTTPIDDHNIWKSSNEVSNALGTIIMSDLEEALQTLPEKLQRQESNALQNIAHHLPGHRQGDTLIEIAGGTVPTTNWASVLRAFLWQMSLPKPTLHRPSRRLPHLIGVVPGRTRIPGRPKVIAVIDTSGSMNNQPIISTIRTELHSLNSVAEIIVVECDTKIHREYKYQKKIINLTGGGGTSFTEPLSKKFLSKHHANVIIYFTDGFGTAPKQKPKIPILWCLIGQWTKKPAPYGKTITINNNDCPV